MHVINLFALVGHLDTHAFTQYRLIPRLAHVCTKSMYYSLVGSSLRQFQDGNNGGWTTPAKLNLLIRSPDIILYINVFFNLLLSLTPSTLSLFTAPPPHLLCTQGVGMANKGPSYGMSRQVQDKIDSKYDPDLELILVEWISRQCGSGVGKPEPGKQGFQAWLKDGCVRVTHQSHHSLTLRALPF